MARVRFTVYKHSVPATIIGIFGTGITYMGVLFLVMCVMDFELAVLLGGIVFIALGIGISALAGKINERAVRKKLNKQQ